MNSGTFGFERWEQWLGGKADALQGAGYRAELRGGGLPTSKPCCSFRLQTDRSLGQFTIWATGETDFDVMDSASGIFAHNVWGVILDDASFEGAFDDFLLRVLDHPAQGRDVPASLHSDWFEGKVRL